MQKKIDALKGDKDKIKEVLDGYNKQIDDIRAKQTVVKVSTA